MKIMGLDYGTRRIGVAMSDELLLTAQGSNTIFNNTPSETIAAIARLVKENGVVEVIVGLPINMNGSHGQKAKEVIEFTENLMKSVTVPVKTWDERLTTREAERALLEADMSRAKRKRLNDMIAAQLILQGYLDYRRKG
ncbi:MAG: Holliday junction resolvase RuvX [Candidatus Omnitrophica bacterium]|nr:Holliday junction resolvase RuvX [Candidatus Omnitrophota bacterium]